jgi:hypothetical protein
LNWILIRAPLLPTESRFAPSGAESLALRRVTGWFDLLPVLGFVWLPWFCSFSSFGFPIQGGLAPLCLIICSRQKICSLPQVRALPAEVQDRGAVLQPGVPLPPLPQWGYGELVSPLSFRRESVLCSSFVSRTVLCNLASLSTQEPYGVLAN